MLDWDRVLDDELASVGCCLFHSRTPILGSTFIEDDVAGNVYMPCHQILHMIGLIVEALVFKLFMIRLHGLDVCHTPECAHVMHNQLVTMPCLVWGHPNDALRRCTVEEMNGCHDSFTPEHGWHGSHSK
jgi:hypothetical protein